MIALKQVLVATDFSAAADAALRYGRALAHAFGAALHVIHVAPDPREWEQHSRDRIGMRLTDRDRLVLRAQIAVRTGEPVRQIVEYAMAHEIDLIVLGTRGRGPVAHLLLGSVAERTVRFAPCPVLTIRPNQHEFVHETAAAPAFAARPVRAVPEPVGA